MDFGKAFSYVFEDEEWLKKIGLAGVITLIPIIGQFVIVGWGLEIVRRVIEDDPEPLPDFTEFGDFLVKGLLVFLVGFVFFLPVILVQGCNVAFIPLLERGDATVETAFGILTSCIVCLTVLYSIVMAFFLPAAVGNYAAKGELSAAFKFRELFQLVKKNFGPYLLVVLGSWVAGLIASLGVIACVIGVLFTSAYSYAVTAHLIGQAYERDTGAVDMNEPIPDAG
jgi:hypothetical protein